MGRSLAPAASAKRLPISRPLCNGGFIDTVTGWFGTQNVCRFPGLCATGHHPASASAQSADGASHSRQRYHTRSQAIGALVARTASGGARSAHVSRLLVTSQRFLARSARDLVQYLAAQAAPAQSLCQCPGLGASHC